MSDSDDDIRGVNVCVCVCTCMCVCTRACVCRRYCSGMCICGGVVKRGSFFGGEFLTVVFFLFINEI